MRVVAMVILCLAALAGIGAWEAWVRKAYGNAEVIDVSVFTLASTGAVFVGPDTTKIIWRNNRLDQKSIGADPWQSPIQALESDLTRFPAWRDNRDIVGNPAYDLVSWVETVDEKRGDVLVVEASTGHVLARAAIQAALNRTVVIASVNPETVYFATPDPRTGFPDVPGDTIWIWRWAAGEDPENLQSSRYYNDVSAGTWAVYGDGLEFEDAPNQTVATVGITDDYPTDFGSSMSPDGAYWYGAGSGKIIETATGNMVTIPTVSKHDYGWTGAAELTVTQPFSVCSARTGQCHSPPEVSPNGACARYAIVCGANPPVN
ncbi:hypothetical protein D9V28_02050 [Mycetocola zhadangensis]|uniref:Uncharacterized protein n=2 Tax=Mycetocola zhadangensis TaxID=1164595 RepID=A0A3L7J8A4_9MICO|nr:hypothetical protein D9V28_02050 [Mycetocola zhadangensis]